MHSGMSRTGVDKRTRLWYNIQVPKTIGGDSPLKWPIEEELKSYNRFL